MIYAVTDTNVLVSALLSSHSDAATVQVVDRLISGRFTPIYDEQIMAEYDDVLHRKKFGFSDGVIKELLETIRKIGESVTAPSTGEMLPDMKDLPFYEVATERQDDNAWLVTGNLKHFPVKPFIVTAREFLDILNKV